MTFARLRPVQRFLLLALGTTPPLMLVVMVAVSVPTGFAAMHLMSLLFVILFAVVASLERSLVVNFSVVLVFWISVSVIHVLYPGTAPGRYQRIVDGILLNLQFVAIHGSMRMGVAWLIRKATYNGKLDAQQFRICRRRSPTRNP